MKKLATTYNDKKYATSFISFYDNELKMDLFMAGDICEALIACLDKYGYEYEGPYNEQDIKTYAFDVDAMVGAIEVFR